MPHRQSPRGRCLAALAARGETPAAFERRLHPGWLRCSSLTYARYARSSRLASRAPRRSRCDAGFHRGLLAATLLLATCGLPTPRPVLHPPSNPVALDAQDEFRFEQPNPPGEFLGYEIYYKLFDESAELEPGLDSRRQLEDLGFLRLTRAGDGTTRPLIPAPTDGHAVVVSFAPIENRSAPTARVDQTASIPLRRGVSDEFGNFRKFEDCAHYAQAHRDLVAVFDSITKDGCAGTLIQIQLYVICYGTWESPLTHKRELLWSDALFLDSITVTLP